MSLFNLLLLGWGSFALLHFLVLPGLERKVRAERSAAVIAKAGTLAALSVLRSVALIVGLTTTCVLLILTVAGLFGGSTSDELAASLERVQGWRISTEWFSPILSGFTFVLLVLAMWFVAKRNGKRRMEGLYLEAYEKEIERLLEQRNSGDWPELPNTNDMDKLTEELNRRQEVLDQLAEMTPPQAEADKAQHEKAIESLSESLLEIQVLYQQLDLARRADVRIDPEQLDYPPPRTIGQKIKYFFVSQGLLGSLDTGAKVLSVVGLALLVLALIGVEAPVVGEKLEARTVRLDELRVAATEKEALEEWRAASESAPEEASEDESEDWSDEDEELAQFAAAAFEDSLSALPAWGGVVEPPTGSLRSQAVREKLLRQAAATGPRQRLATLPSLSEAPDLGKFERETIRAYQDSVRTSRASTEAGQKVYREMREVSRTRPAVWQRMRASIRSGAASFQRPAAAHDLSRMMLSRLVGTAAEGVVDSSTAVGELAGKVLVESSEEALGRLYRVESSRYLADLANGSPVDEAAGRISAPKAKRPVWTVAEGAELRGPLRQGLPRATTLQNHPPTLVAQPEPHVRAEVASRKLDGMRNRVAGPVPGQAGSEFADALARFDDHFPGQMGSSQTTPRGRRLESWGAGVPDEAGSLGGGGGGGGGGGLGVPEGRARSPRTPPGASSARRAASRPTAFGRSRSFVRLRGFSRVGGVLIGREPETLGEKRADYVELRWREAQGDLALTLVDASGEQLELGIYRPATVHQALSYSADGRPVTVTMVSAQPLMELKILLHPALVDTPLGCRAIELDRLVDTFTANNAARTQAEREIQGQYQLYLFTWATRIKAILAEAKGDLPEELYAAVAEMGDGVMSNLDGEAVVEALESTELIGNPSRSPLAVKSEYFDSKIVGYMEACGATANELREYMTCVAGRSQSDLSTYLPAYGDPWPWFYPPPEFQVWSGVRERPFDFDPNLHFLRAPDGDSVEDSLWPFDFVLQVAFTTPPAFLETDSDAELENYTDSQPWEFPALHKEIQEAVWSGVVRQREYLSVVTDLQDFTVLQRLVRLALDGHLGERFPIERLTTLMEEAARFPRSMQRTLRWNARPGALEAMTAQRLGSMGFALEETISAGSVPKDELVKAAETALALQRCYNLVSASDRPDLIPQTTWTARCTLDDLGSWARARQGQQPSDVTSLIVQAAETAALMSSAREVRQDLGVARDDVQVSLGATCKPI